MYLQNHKQNPKYVLQKPSSTNLTVQILPAVNFRMEELLRSRRPRAAVALEALKNAAMILLERYGDRHQVRIIGNQGQLVIAIVRYSSKQFNNFA